MMPAVVIALAMFKGGVAKTTTVVNLAVCIARIIQERDPAARVLVVDTDPQANASESFIPESEIKGSLRSVIVDKKPIEQVIQPTHIPGLDVLPANFDLAMLSNELVVSPSGVTRIERALRPVLGSYEYIIIDTGPNLSHLTLGALYGSDYIIFPVSATVWGSKALVKFMGWIEEARRDELVTAEILGLLATLVPTQTRIGKAIVQQLQESPWPVFDTIIPRRIGNEDAVLERVFAGEPGMEPEISQAYVSFADEVVSRVGTKTGGAHRA